MPTYLLLDPSPINALMIITLLFEPALIEVFCDRSSMRQSLAFQYNSGGNSELEVGNIQRQGTV
ncbi:hypothetical protein [Nostoc sp.]|uniref:hypothetical protein n=1 Tax=Nostoc sp. TaxID=1180 RepID=UPI002FF69B35